MHKKKFFNFLSIALCLSSGSHTKLSCFMFYSQINKTKRKNTRNCCCYSKICPVGIIRKHVVCRLFNNKTVRFACFYLCFVFFSLCCSVLLFLFILYFCDFVYICHVEVFFFFCSQRKLCCVSYGQRTRNDSLTHLNMSTNPYVQHVIALAANECFFFRLC